MDKKTRKQKKNRGKNKIIWKRKIVIKSFSLANANPCSPVVLGLCRTGVLTDVKISQNTRVAHSGGKPKSGLPGGPVQ